MDINENIAGLGKDHDRSVGENDLAKKQSTAQPAAENLDMNPNSVSKSDHENFDAKDDDQHNEALHHKAKIYAEQEHNKAKDWSAKEE